MKRHEIEVDGKKVLVKAGYVPVTKGAAQRGDLYLNCHYFFDANMTVWMTDPIVGEDFSMYSLLIRPITVQEQVIRSWEVSDGYGWRKIDLIQDGRGELSLVAYDKDGGEVPPNLSEAW